MLSAPWKDALNNRKYMLSMCAFLFSTSMYSKPTLNYKHMYVKNKKITDWWIHILTMSGRTKSLIFSCIRAFIMNHVAGML